MNQTIVNLVLIVVVFNLVGCGKYPSPIIWEPAIKAFESADAKKPPDENSIVFVGSSTIRKWKTLEKDMAPLPIIQRGFGGSTLNDLVFYAQRIITSYNPGIIVVYAGDNDIFLGISPEVILDKYKELIETLRIELPITPIFYISIKPSPARWHLWEDSLIANALIETETESDPLLHYIDVTGDMLQINGEVDAELFLNDNTHLNELGYEVWTEQVRPVLEQVYLHQY